MYIVIYGHEWDRQFAGPFFTRDAAYEWLSHDNRRIVEWLIAKIEVVE